MILGNGLYSGVFSVDSSRILCTGRLLPVGDVLGCSMSLRTTPGRVRVSDIKRNGTVISLLLTKGDELVGQCNVTRPSVSDTIVSGPIITSYGERCGYLVGSKSLWNTLVTLPLPLTLPEDSLLFSTDCVHFLPLAAIGGKIKHNGKRVSAISWNTDTGYITVDAVSGEATITISVEPVQDNLPRIETIIVNGVNITGQDSMYITLAGKGSGVRLGSVYDGIVIGRSKDV